MLYYDILYFLILMRNINCFNIYIFILFKFTKSIKKKNNYYYSVYKNYIRKFSLKLLKYIYSM